MKTIKLISLAAFISVCSVNVYADKHKDENVPLKKLKNLAIKSQARGNKWMRELKAFQNQQDKPNATAISACKAASEVCSAKLNECNECIESWTSGFGAFCSICTEAAGACEAAAAACKAINE